MLVVTSLISLFFGVPATMLCYVHVKNYSAGKTTNERFARGARAESEIAESLGSVSDFRSMKQDDDADEG